jgi:hypothetical protein
MSKQKPFGNQHTSEHDQRVWVREAMGCQDFMDAFHPDRYSGNSEREAHAQQRLSVRVCRAGMGESYSGGLMAIFKPKKRLRGR